MTPHLARRIVLTGGPGGGKTTAVDLFRRELGESVVVVPEAATLLFSGGFPRSQVPQALREVQTAIFYLQRSLENVQAACYPHRTLLCDRGTVDGGAFWPSNGEDFFAHMNTSLDEQLERYDAVIFFESAAVGGITIEGGNRVRTESLSEAVELDRRLRELWGRHAHFTLVPHRESFFDKLSTGLAALREVVASE